ncbi:ABC transporter ATP-binding protein [Marinobacter nanhaiticus D15-8W]|uniref:ABC transporter ATP-binding protein n=1 Tax=Marinobacter nanhaiticus D15-8W TaxID=626887 RepID=N6X1T6_9GAMM|nr:ABC transporter ATP-binding protein [Marinobacter nanhaiticus D15-8W]BES69262.1 ABC transporter ATP-binding protein [Marinobacter nanhaiticus D15-8W]
MTKAHLELTGVSMAFDTPQGPFQALDTINLKIRKGEFVSLIGHSGCGKSTVLNIVAGLLQASRGGCVLDGHEVNTPGPERAVVFQNHALMPWLTVYENVELAVRQVFRKTMSKAERRDWIIHNLELVNMAHARDKRPGEISGGMAQRVGIARALSMRPSVLLMDEPFGALDALTRAHLQDALMEIQQDLNSTVIMITHDVDEAVLLSDRIVMMTNGPAATIGEELNIELPRPRNRVTLADDDAYVHYRQAVLRFLYEKQRFPGKEKNADKSKAAAPKPAAETSTGTLQPSEESSAKVVAAPSAKTGKAVASVEHS